MSRELEELARAARLYAIECERRDAGEGVGASEDWLRRADRDVQESLDALQEAAIRWAS